MTASLAERLRTGIVLGAERYVFELERRGYIKAGPFVPEVVLDFPDAVRELHREFSETNDYLGEALIALEVIGGLGLPAMVTLAPTQPHLTARWPCSRSPTGPMRSPPPWRP
jgi:hypothetical protein